MHIARLLLVDSVDEDQKLVCQAPGCGRAIAKAVHVIRDEAGMVRVIGSGCYVKLAGHKEATEAGAAFAGFDGRRLTPEERALMVANTAAFVARVEAMIAAEREEAARLREQEEQARAARQQADRERAPLSDGREPMRRGEAALARDQLNRYRAQQAAGAARQAIARFPELAAYSEAKVATAMQDAKARLVARGLPPDRDGFFTACVAKAIELLQAKRQSE